MAIIYTDFVSGTLTTGITISAATFTSAGLTSLSAVGGTDVAKIVLDPFGQFGAPEIVYVTGHAAASNTVTGVQRGQEGTTARPHNSGVLLMNVPTSADFRDLRNTLGNITGSPGTTLITAAPVDLVAGGAAQTGSSIALSKSDHRHALAASTPVASSPGDVVADGTATSVARSDHKHAREPWATTVAPIGTATVGSAASVPHGDHAHALGTGALASISQVGSGLEVPIICTSATRPAHAKGRTIVETDTNRRYESDGTNWLRRETLLNSTAQPGISLTASPTISNINTVTRVTSLTPTSHNPDGFQVDGQYTKIPANMPGLYMASWQVNMHDGSNPSWLEVQFVLTTEYNGLGGNAVYTAHNGTKSVQAQGSRILSLVANQVFVINVVQAAGLFRQVDVVVDLYLLTNTSG